MRECLLSAVKACFTGTRTRCNKELSNAQPPPAARLRPYGSRHLRAGSARRGVRRATQGRADLVVRADARSCWRVQRRRLLGGEQAQRRQRGVAAQRRVLQLRERRDPPLPRRHRPRGRRDPAVRDAQHGRTASHPAAQDHFTGVHAAGRRTVARRAESAGGEHRQDRRRSGRRRLRRAGVARAAAAGHRGAARCAPGGPHGTVPVVQRDDRQRRSRVRRRRPQGVVGGADHVRDEDGRGEVQRSGRGHRDRVDRGRHRRREAVRRRVRLLRRAAGRRGQRDPPQLHPPRHDRLRRQPRSVGAVQEGATGNRGRRDCPVGDSGHLLPAHRARGHRTVRRADQEGPAVGHVLPVGEFRRGSLRRSGKVRYHAKPQPARRLWRHRGSLLHRCEPGQDDHRPDLQRGRRPHARPDTHFSARATALRLAQRHQALAGRLPRWCVRVGRRFGRQVSGGALMDFTLDPAQQAVADVVTSALDRDNSFQALVAGGVTALGVPDRLGGDGVGLSEIATALTEIGRYGTVSPALATLGLGLVPLLDLATAEQQDRYLAGVAKGGVLTAALNEPGAPLPDRPVTTLANNRLTGTKIGVPYAEQAQWMIVTADSGVVVVSPKAAGVTLTKTPTSNDSDEYVVTFSDVEVDGVLAGATPHRLNQLALAVTGAFAAGLVAGALRLTADYVGSRHQFGKPLSTFQTVAAQLAEGYIASRTITLGSTSVIWRLSEGRDADDDLDVLGYWLTSQAPPVMQICHHLHGGMGMAITYPMARYYSTIKDLTRLLGGPSHRLDLVGAQCS